MSSISLIQNISSWLRPMPWKGKTTAWRLLYKKLPAQDSYEVTFPEGYKMILHPAEDLWEYLMMAASYERRERWLFKKILRPGDTMIDGGANIGYHTCLAASCVKGGHVYAFEPHPRTGESLERNAKLNPHLPISISHTALSDQTGTGQLSMPEDAHNGLHPNQSSLTLHREQKIQNVPITTLDRFIEDQNIKKVTLTKLDLEGGEPAAVRGAKKSLSAGIIESLVIEVTEENHEILQKELEPYRFEFMVNLRSWEKIKDLSQIKRYLPQPNVLFARGDCAGRYENLKSWEKCLV